MLQVLIAISQRICYKKEAWGYAKVIHKKREIEKEKRIENNGQVSKISKTIGS